MEENMAQNLPISLVIFDIAGTLMEDTGVLMRSFLQMFEASGIPASEAEIQEWRGAAKRDVIRHFVSRQPGQGSTQIEEKVDEAYLTFRRLLEGNYRSENVKPIAGAENTLDWLKKRDILIATTTGFYREVRDLVLEKLGWDGSFFDCNVCSDDVPKGRPAPYMIFECMSRLEVLDVNRVIVIGDTPLDLQAGCNAGCRGVIGVLTGAHGIESLGMERHTHIISGAANLPELLEKEFLSH
jgi:phosphonatase-like hydrolase